MTENILQSENKAPIMRAAFKIKAIDAMDTVAGRNQRKVIEVFAADPLRFDQEWQDMHQLSREDGRHHVLATTIDGKAHRQQQAESHTTHSQHSRPNQGCAPTQASPSWPHNICLTPLAGLTELAA